ncbi:MAG TPA: anaerobic ribonucleoside-triphosphate reductase activating protein [Anaerovoracaceae bacterium]|nr:anaerobic ribonucleoside-triphosphate reductase activating protein [Anaerovoracaceae bacterium]
MRIAGIIKSSLIDYHKKASTVIFLGGCNFRCGYCHNPELLTTDPGQEDIEQDDLMKFLMKRKRFIDGVCISGGEPTLNNELPRLIEKIKDIGLLVKLDTNGSNPAMIKRLIAENLLDYVAMDIKGPMAKYKSIAGERADTKDILLSAKILSDAYKNDNFPCEFRTTVCKEQLDGCDLKKMISEYPNHPPWYLQRFHNPGKILDSDKTYSAYSADEMKALGEMLCVNVR